MLKATKFEILRGVEANGRISIPLERRPVRVATLLNEEEFSRTQLMTHNRTVFFEDYVHDWNWSNGKFRYYTRIATKADVLLVYAVEDVQPAANFDIMTGEPLKAKAGGSERDSYEKKILDVLPAEGGLTTGDVAKLVTPQFGHNARSHSGAVRAWLLGLEKDGLVKQLDDEKPVCWVKVGVRSE